MHSGIYRYEFQGEVEDLEASVLLAVVATEALHGESAVELAAPYLLDLERRACVVDASTPVGGDFNRLLHGLLRREFSAEDVRVRRVDQTPSAA